METKRPSYIPRRLTFQNAEHQRLAPNQCLARVQLEQREFGRVVGTAVSTCTDCGGVEGLRATAKATAAALMQAAGLDHSLKVSDVELLDTLGHTVVLVQLSARLNERSQSLTGMCVTGADSTRAAALAVLNAANRVLNVG